MERRRVWIAVALGIGALIAWLIWPAPERARSAGPSAPELSDDRVAGSGTPAGRQAAEASAGGSGEQTEPRRGALWVTVRAGGEPVPGAEVTAWLQGPEDPNTGRAVWTRVGSGATDASGLVRLAVAPGVYQLSASAGGYATAHRRITSLREDARTEVTLSLSAARALSGTVVEKGSGQPVPLAELRVLPLLPDAPLAGSARELPDEEALTAVSDGEGRFRVDGVEAGWVRVEARAAGHARAVLPRVAIPRAGPLTVALPPAAVIQGFVREAGGEPAAGAQVEALGQDSPQTTQTGAGGGFSLELEAGSFQLIARKGPRTAALDQPVVVAAGRTRTVELTLGAGAGLGGSVKDAQGPVQGAIVSLSPLGANGDLGRALTAPDGSYRVEGLPPGSYDLVVDAQGHARQMKRGLTLAAGDLARVDLTLGGLGGVEGRVLDPLGAPVAGALVSALREESLSDAPAAARTDAAGRYRLEGLTPGVALLSVSLDGAAAQSFRTRVPEDALGHLDLVLRATGTIHGVVRGASPDDALTVWAHRGRFEDGNRSARVDPDGSFTLEVAAGQWRLRVEGAQGDARSDNPGVEVLAGATAEVVLTLARSARPSLDCEVLEPDGAPSAGAFLWVEGQGGAPVDETGHASVELARPGPDLRLKVHARRGGSTGELSDAAPGHACVVRLRAGGRIDGRVSGEPAVAGFTLRAGNDAAQWQATQERPADRFTLADVPPGTVHLAVSLPDGRTASTELQLPEAGAQTVELVVSAGIAITGRVVEASSGRGLPDARVVVDRAWSAPISVDPGGRFRVTVPSAGQHELRLWIPGRAFVTREVTVLDGPVDLGEVPLEGALSPGLVGLSIEPGVDAQVLVKEVSPGGPAARAGVLVGDQLLAVDGAPVQSANDAVTRIKGAPGTAVTLSLRRGRADQTVVVIRAQ